MDANTDRCLIYEGHDPAETGLREVLCALGNGVFVTRAAAAWASADGTNYPGTYLAGGYDRAASEVADRLIENEDLVNLPNWLPITFRLADGPWFDERSFEITDLRQELDLRRGLLRVELRARDPEGRAVTLVERRLVHLTCPQYAAQQLTVELDEPVDRFEIKAGIDGGIENAGVRRYHDLERRHLDGVEVGHGDGRIWLHCRTRSSRLGIAVGARVTVHGLDGPTRRVEAGTERIDVVETGSVDGPCRVTLTKITALHTSRDRPGYEPLTDVHRSLDHTPSFDELVRTQERAWEDQWRRSGLTLQDHEEDADGILALHLFHLHQTFSDHTRDLDVGIPARGWHGEAYRGHIFWDELFILPFFNYRVPQRTRAALRYRHRRLPEARRAAAEAGCRGAMFPWQSGTTGREENQRWHLNPRSGRWNPDPTHLQRHVGLAIAYNVSQHWQVTADAEFLHDYGAELILSIADYFADLAEWEPIRDRYVIRGVIGPDEYHTAYPGADRPGLDNNAYTNVMTSWVLGKALDVLDELPPMRRDELTGILALDDDRLAHWRDVRDHLFVPFLADHDQRILAQFEGYEELEEFDWDGYRARYGDIARLDRILEAEDRSPNDYRLSKQADVVMIFYLLTADELVGLLDRLGYPFSADDIPANVAYYCAHLPRLDLSRVVHAWVQARSDRAASWRFYQEALRADLFDSQGGTTPEGIHLGAMAGTVDMAQRVYSGLTIDGDVVRLNPRLPDELRMLSFAIRFRTHWTLHICVDEHRLSVTCESSRPDPVQVAVKAETVTLHPGRTHDFDLAALKDQA